jgi:CDP-glycerol glycerophosphotransferase (TagB/SpsB family)
MMNKKVKTIWNNIKYWSQALLLPVYALSHLMPRDKHIWVMGSTFGRRFADNPKYFYLYLNQHHRDDIRAIWISKDKSIVNLLNKNLLEAYYLYSLKGIWFALRAKVYLYDNYSKDICFTLSGGATKVNLWHGIPLKKIQKDNQFDLVRNPKNRLQKIKWALRRVSDEKPTDYVLVTSDYLKPIFSSAFNTKNTIVCGYPRNDFLITDSIDNIATDDEKAMYNNIINKAKDHKVILYMPTFRDSEHRFFDVISITQFESYLKEHNYVFYVKLHPKSKVNERFMELQSKYIKVINPEYDPYPLLKLIDVLITDYSSIYFDFMLTNKPIIFFPYDLEEYLMKSREMYFDYEEFTPGNKVFIQEDLEKALLETDKHHNDRERILQKVFDLQYCNTGSENLYMYILEKLLIHRKD